MLGCSCSHQKFEKLILSQPRVINPCHEFAEPSGLRVIFHKGGDRPHCGLRGSS